MTELRITAIDVYKSDIPLVTPFRIAVMETTHAENLFVRIDTDRGLAGLGESSPTAALELDHLSSTGFWYGFEEFDMESV